MTSLAYSNPKNRALLEQYLKYHYMNPSWEPQGDRVIYPRGLGKMMIINGEQYYQQAMPSQYNYLPDRPMIVRPSKKQHEMVDGGFISLDDIKKVANSAKNSAKNYATENITKENLKKVAKSGISLGLDQVPKLLSLATTGILTSTGNPELAPFVAPVVGIVAQQAREKFKEKTGLGRGDVGLYQEKPKRGRPQKKKLDEKPKPKRGRPQKKTTEEKPKPKRGRPKTEGGKAKRPLTEYQKKLLKYSKENGVTLSEAMKILKKKK